MSEDGRHLSYHIFFINLSIMDTKMYTDDTDNFKGDKGDKGDSSPQTLDRCDFFVF